MSKTYRPYDPNQLFLLPPSIKDWLPEGHLAYFIDDVFDHLDLSAIEQVYEREERGYPPYHPRMMAKVLFYAQCVGVRSSRGIARRLEEDVAFRVLSAGNTPKYRAIAEFRSRHLQALSKLFTQVVLICAASGLVPLKHVAVDGTKIKANASKHKAMSYGRMKQARERIEGEIREYLQRTKEIDDREDQEYGEERRGDELPEELAIREKRLNKIREAMASLEEEANAQGIRKAEDRGAKKRLDKEGKPPKTPLGTPKEKSQRNFTDPESRIMKNSDKAFIQGYNAQAVVDDESQIIVAADATNQASDCVHLIGLVEQVEINLGRKPKKLLADAGYYSEENIRYLDRRKITACVPPEKQRHSDPVQSAARGRIPQGLTTK